MELAAWFDWNRHKYRPVCLALLPTYSRILRDRPMAVYWDRWGQHMYRRYWG